MAEEQKKKEEQKPASTKEVMDDAKKDKEPKKGSVEHLNDIIKDTQMSLPDVSDFEAGAIDTRIYEELAKQMGSDLNAALFYQENPPLENVGVDKVRGLAMVSLPPKAFRISEEDLHAGFVDGDTLYADLRKANVKDPELLAFLTKGQQNMRAWLAQEKTNSEDVYDINNVKDENYSLDYDMGFRFLFYDAPEVYHWSVVYATDVIKTTYGEAVNKYNAFVTKAHDASTVGFGNKWEKNKDTDECVIAQVAEFDNRWIEVNEKLTTKRFGGLYPHGNAKSINRRTPVFGLSADGTQYALLETAYKAANEVVHMIKNATEIRAVIDINGSSKQDQTTAYPKNFMSFSGDSLLANYVNTINQGFLSFQDPTIFKETGINMYGLEHYRRNLAVIYVKHGDKWINLNKYVISKNNNMSILKYSDFTNPNLKPWTYEYDSKVWVDAVWNVTDQLDKRHEIQNKAFHTTNINHGLESISDWTCTLGDVTLFVPPISISTVTQANSQNIPLMRAKGSANIENAKADRLLQMELYFNEDRGINGEPVKVQTNSSNKKKEITYYMNGFRALLSEFHFVPYMPIENKYINETLDIDAVCFEAISVATVPNYPKLLKVTLLLREFDYQAFMPQVPKHREIEGGTITKYRNFFAKTINYDLLRWYYQRPLILGNELHSKQYPIFSKDFMKRTMFSNRSALMPVDTLNPRIDFYVPDEAKLIKLEKIRQTYTKTNKKTPNRYRPSSADKALFSEANRIFKTLKGKYFANEIKNLSASKTSQYDFLNNAGTKLTNYLNQFGIQAYYDIVEPKINLVNEAKEAADFVLSGGEAKPVIDLNNPDNKTRLIIHVKPVTQYNSLEDSLLLRQQFASTLTKQGSSNMPENVQNLNNGRPIDTDVYNSIFKKEEFSLSLIVNEKDNKLSLDYYPYDTDSKFLEYCASQFDALGTNEDTYNALSGNEQQYEEYEDSEFERLTSIDYRLYLKDVLVQGLTANFTNTYANMSVDTHRGQAPQYMGGQDATLTFSVMTYDQATVDAFDKIPKIISYFKKKYPNALPSYPFRIESEFTKLLGVYEVIVEQVAISTVPNYPGLFQIKVSLRQTDRTLRNRFAVYKQFEIENYASNLATSQKAAQAALGYFDIDANLSKAELYPDLQLPTIKELGELGFEFIRYKNPGNQVFVDPDFYFCYHETLFSELLRDIILMDSKMVQLYDEYNKDGKKPEKTVEMVAADDTGRRVEYSQANGMTIASNGGLSLIMDKKEWDLTEQKINALKKEENDIRLKLVKHGVNTGQWKIGKTVAASFMEPYYSWMYYHLKESQEWNEVGAAENKKALEKAKGPGATILDPRTQVDENSKVYKENKAEYDKAKADQKKREADNANKSENALKSVLVDSIDTFVKIADDALEFLRTIAIEEGNQDKVLLQHFYNIIVETKSVQQNTFEDWQNKINDTLNKFVAAAILSGVDSDLSSEKQQEMAKNFIEFAKKSSEKKDDKDNKKPGNYSGMSDTLMANKSVKEALEKKQEDELKENKFNLRSTKYLIEQAKLNYDPEIDKNFWRYGSIVEMGVFGIPCFTEEEFKSNSLLNIMNVDFAARKKKFADKKYTFLDSDHYYFIDPYYQTSDYSETMAYMKGCISDYNYAKNAFLRNMLFWMCTLIKNNIFPNYMTDILFNNANGEISAYEYMKDMDLSKDIQEKNITTMKNFIKDNQEKFVNGKLFVSYALSAMAKDNDFIKKITTRDYNSLNATTHKVLTPALSVTAPLNDSDMILRRLLFALVPVGIVEKTEELGVDISTNNPISQIERDYTQRLELEANGMSPHQLSRRVRDSFLDMVQTDIRGRMLRGFPTFQVMFIDEGLTSGFWKMHDSFYSTNAISSIQVVKSKNIAADTATIQLNNAFQNILAEYDSDGDNDNYVQQLQSGLAALDNLYDSIFNPRTFVRNAQQKQDLIPERSSIKLVAGARIHIRMGYSADAAKLPPMFNGMITEIIGGDVVNIVAQSDGIELSNPIREDNYGDRIKNRGVHYFQDSPYGKSFGGVSPRVLISSFLTSQDQNSFSKVFRENNWNILSRVFSKNPFGIYHFGDAYYRDIFANGEPVQNIYEVTNDGTAHYYNSRINNGILDSLNPLSDGNRIITEEGQERQEDTWTINQLANTFGLGTQSGHQYINIKTQGRTVWDILQFSASAEPTYIGAIANFGFRSTVFLGKPDWYFAYKYTKQGKNYNVIEKRKPYSQMHMYWSNHDIMSNQIQTNINKVATVAKGMYNFEDVKKTTQDVYLDRDIYPEYQRSAVVDTWLHARTQINTSSDNTFTIDSEIGSLDNYATTTGLTLSAVGGAVGSRGGMTGSILGGALGFGVGALLEKGVKSLASWTITNWLPPEFGGSEHNHELTARNMTISRLKRSVEQIYSGNLVVYGDPSVKPHDRIAIIDEPNSMTGQAKVRDVVHMMSVTTGFVTTITPDAIVDPLNDMTTKEVNMSFISTVARYTTYAVGLYNLSRTLLVQAIVDDFAGAVVRSKGWFAERYADKIKGFSEHNKNPLYTFETYSERRTMELQKIDDTLKELYNKKAKGNLSHAQKEGITARMRDLVAKRDKISHVTTKDKYLTYLGSKNKTIRETMMQHLNDWIKTNHDFEISKKEAIGKFMASIHKDLDEAKKSYEYSTTEEARREHIKKESDKMFKDIKEKQKTSGKTQTFYEVDVPEFDEDGNAIFDENGKQKTTKKTIRGNKGDKNASRELRKLFEKKFSKEWDLEIVKRKTNLEKMIINAESISDKIKGVNNTTKGAAIIEELKNLKGLKNLTEDRLKVINNSIIKMGGLGTKLELMASSIIGKRLTGIISKGLRFAGNPLVILGSFVLGRWGEMIKNFVDGYKTLCVTPLIKRGMPFIPAWGGNSGTIFMSPTWGTRGPMLDLVDNIFNYRVTKTGNFSADSWEYAKGAGSWLLNMLLGGGPGEAIEKYRTQENNMLVANNQGGQQTYTMADNYISTLFQYGDIRTMSQIVNVNDKTIKAEKELSRANAKMFMHENDLTIFNDTSLLRPLVPVPGPEFDIFKQTKFFVIRHEKALFNEERPNTVEFNIEQGGRFVKVVGIKGKDGDGKEILDANILHPFALNVLRKIIFAAEQELSYKGTADYNTYINKVSNDYITLASCYLFGTDKLYPGSGFGFTLIGHGESAANLDKILYALQGAKELEYTVDDSSADIVYKVNVNIPKL